MISNSINNKGISVFVYPFFLYYFCEEFLTRFYFTYNLQLVTRNLKPFTE